MAKKDPIYDHLKEACDFSGGTLPLVVHFPDKATADYAKETLKGMKNNKVISIRTFPHPTVGVVPLFVGGKPPVSLEGATPVTPQSEVDDLV